MPNDITAIRQTLSDNYFPADKAEIKEIAAGGDSYNFLVSLGSRRFVLKWYENMEQEKVLEELSAMKWLKAQGVPLPGIVENRAGVLLTVVAGASVVLLEYIEGVAADDRLRSGILIATFLADFHTESTKYSGEFCSDRSEFVRLKAFKDICEDRKYLNVDGIQSFIADYLREIELFAEARSHTGDKLETGVIHHDLHADNFLIDDTGNSIKAMLDFSEAHKGFLVFDLAVLLGYWARDSQNLGLDMDKCRRLLSAYNERRPIRDAQMTLLPHAVLLYFATDATGYILPRLSNPKSSVVTQCNMYQRFRRLREHRAWMAELANVLR